MCSQAISHFELPTTWTVLKNDKIKVNKGHQNSKRNWIFYPHKKLLKFRYSEKVLKSLAHLPLFLLTLLSMYNYKWKMDQIFVASSEYRNFTEAAIAIIIYVPFFWEWWKWIYLWRRPMYVLSFTIQFLFTF